jgi:hypothetical protein
MISGEIGDHVKLLRKGTALLQTSAYKVNHQQRNDNVNNEI